MYNQDQEGVVGFRQLLETSWLNVVSLKACSIAVALCKYY